MKTGWLERELVGTLKRIANTGKPPEGQTVIRPAELMDPLRIRDQIRAIRSQLVMVDTGEDKLKMRCERIEKMVEERSRKFTETRQRLTAEKRALQEKLIPFCHECDLFAKVPD